MAKQNKKSETPSEQLSEKQTETIKEILTTQPEIVEVYVPEKITWGNKKIKR